METRANYVLIGGFTLIVAAFALIFGLWAGKVAVDTEWDHYIIRFTQSVTGVSVGSPVLYNGINVGQISDLQLNMEDLREVIVTIQVDPTIPLHEDTEAGIRLLGLTGLAGIQLSGGAPESPILEHGPGRPPPEIRARESAFSLLLESSEGMLGTANTILLQMEKLLNDENIDQVSQTLTGLRQFSDTLADQRQQFAALVQQAEQASASLNAVLDNADQTLTQARSIIGQVDGELIASLPQMVERLQHSLDNVAAFSARADAILASNQASLMNVGSDSIDQIGPGLEELRTLIRELSVIAESLSESPSDFLLGGNNSPEEYEP